MSEPPISRGIKLLGAVKWRREGERDWKDGNAVRWREDGALVELRDERNEKALVPNTKACIKERRNEA